MDNRIEKIKQAIVDGNPEEIEPLLQEAVDGGLDPDDIINYAMIAAMDEVGRRFSAREVFVPEMLVSAFAMTKGMNMLEPLLRTEPGRTKGKIIMCTVEGDIHDIGKNLVVMMLEGAGFDVIDLGVDINVGQVIERIKEIGPDILGLSSLLTTTMIEMGRVIETLGDQGLRDNLKIMVGGAPLSADFAQKIGADGYGRDASEAVELAKRMAD